METTDFAADLVGPGVVWAESELSVVFFSFVLVLEEALRST